MRTLHGQAAATQAGPFATVACVTDGTRLSKEAIRQAGLLAGLGGRIELVAAGGVEDVLARCRDHDLLALPAGPLARAVLPRAELPVLVARTVPGEPGFPGSVLVAVDGSDEAHEAARLGARLAADTGAELALVATPEHDRRHQNALQLDAATVERITGRRPLILDEHGPPAISIATAAASLGASLIVIGSRPGHPAGSVSAEVAERAGCSVLVLRPGRAVSRPGASAPT